MARRPWMGLESGLLVLVLVLLAALAPLVGKGRGVLVLAAIIGVIVLLIRRTQGDTALTGLLVRERGFRAEAEAVSRSKEEFFATISHELRGPLNAILGWVRLLLDGRLDPPTTRHGLETIQRSARAQARLIQELLDVSRIIGGNLRLEVRPLALATVIEEATQAVRPAASAKAIRLETSIAPTAGTMDGDPARLEQVVTNLFSNAIKFTPEGGRVTVALDGDAQHARITVRDTGQGIRSDLLPHVFDRFRQADDAATRLAGLGLGLAIVRHLVELHGGTVAAESAGEGQGACFTVKLPRSVPSNGNAETAG
jgi:signal transduction histidine kinase